MLFTKMQDLGSTGLGQFRYVKRRGLLTMLTLHRPAAFYFGRAGKALNLCEITTKQSRSILPVALGMSSSDVQMWGTENRSVPGVCPLVAPHLSNNTRSLRKQTFRLSPYRSPPYRSPPYRS